MASTRRKSAAVAIAIVGIAGLSLAAAAQLTLDSESLGAGSIEVASCDEDSVDVTYTRAWSATAGADVTTAVNFDGVDSDCDTLAYELTVLGASNAVLQSVTGTVALTGDAFSATIAQDSADIEGVALVIHG